MRKERRTPKWVGRGIISTCKDVVRCVKEYVSDYQNAHETMKTSLD